MLDRDDQCCMNCYYWLEGNCRRYPPKIPRDNKNLITPNLGKWPIIGPEEWCGEWRHNNDTGGGSQETGQANPEPV